jgi:hypothetical protein
MEQRERAVLRPHFTLKEEDVHCLNEDLCTGIVVRINWAKREVYATVVHGREGRSKRLCISFESITNLGGSLQEFLRSHLRRCLLCHMRIDGITREHLLDDLANYDLATRRSAKPALRIFTGS